MASKLSPTSARRNERSGAVISKKGLRLNAENVVRLLLKTSMDWRWLAQKILGILSSKVDVMGGNSTDEECLQQAVGFWFKRFVYASWRWIIFMLDEEYESVSDEIRSFSEPLLDTSLTSDNISAALATLDDEEFEEVVGVSENKMDQFRQQSSSDEEYRILLINYWMMTDYNATWEELARRCFYVEKEKALEEVKKHFQRKLESTLTLENLINVLADVKDWSDEGLPESLRIPDSKVNELEKTYPDLTQRQSAIIQLFLEKHPAPSWELICFGLYMEGEYEALEVVQNKYFKGTSETRRHFQVAMKRGKGKTSTTKVVLFGAAESGKTCTKHVILDEKPPVEYTTTPLGLRPVTVFSFDMTPSQWKKLTRKDRDLILARACQMQNAYELAQLSIQPSVEAPDVKASSTNVTADQSVKKVEAKTNDTTSDVKAASLGLIPRSKGESTPFLPSLETYEGLLACMDECSFQVDGNIFVIKRVQVADCGGQSQFHQILPIFVRDTTLYLFVCKLNEALSAHPMVKYSVKGKKICNSYPCSESYEQMFQQCLRVIRSQKAKGERKRSNLMIIGTHKDKEHECKTESRKDKNAILLDMLLPEFEDEIHYHQLKPSKEVIFPLNAQFPGEEEKKIAAEIRRLISVECEAEAVDIPLQWHALEALLEDLTKAFGRDVISKEECFAAAKDLHFEDESALNAALQYLDQLNLIYYYPDILPGVVFASAQVLLDKVTELVLAVHELQDGKTATAMSRLQDEKWQRFCDHALVSADFLAQELFQRHYVPGVFNHINLMDLFKELLIFAHFSSTEVLVPAILKKLTKQELDKYRICCSSSSSSTSCSLEHASPLVLSFPKHGGPLLGVFCATIVALLSEDNAQPNQWALKMEEDEVTPSCLFQNCVQFEIEDHPGSVTLIDSFEHIEVHISKAAATMEGYPASIKHAVIERIRRATLALHYNYSKPDFGFGCPCNSRPGFHLAKLGKSSRWICSKNKELCGALSSCHKVWLEELESPQKATTTVESVPMTHHNRSPKEIDSPSLDSALKQPTSSNIETHQQQKETSHEQGQLPPASKTVVSTKNEDSTLITLDIDSTSKSHQLDVVEYNNKRIKLIDCVDYKWEDNPITHQHKQTSLDSPEHGKQYSASDEIATRKNEPSEIVVVDIDSTPMLHQLDFLEYNNKQLKLIDRVAYKWEDIAIRLHFEGHSVSEINRDSHFQAHAACQKMFIKWTQGVGRKPTTWKTLITALKEAGLGEVADELHKVINKTYD